jgi:hypothetical protein
MLLAFDEHAPQARCDNCGSPQVASICHHCGKSLCEKHTPPAVKRRSGRPVSRELIGLGLDNSQAAVYHCSEHGHVVKGGLMAVILTGTGVAVIGAIVLLAGLRAYASLHARALAGLRSGASLLSRAYASLRAGTTLLSRAHASLRAGASLRSSASPRAYASLLGRAHASLRAGTTLLSRAHASLRAGASPQAYASLLSRAYASLHAGTDLLARADASLRTSPALRAGTSPRAYTSLLSRAHASLRVGTTLLSRAHASLRVGTSLLARADADASLRTGAALRAGLVLLVLGAGVAVVSALARRRRKAKARAVRPLLQVLPSVHAVKVTETLRGEVNLLADGRCESPVLSSGGVVELVLTLNKSDQDRLDTYRARYGLTEDDPVEFSAGFAVFAGDAGLIFDREHAPTDSFMDANAVLPGSTGLSFRGEVAGHPLFSTGPGRSTGRWMIRLPYDLQRARALDRVPLWIVPSLAEGSDRRTLHLDLRWVPLDAERPEEERRDLRFLRFDAIELVVPKVWGNVEVVSPANARISNPETAFTRTINWKLPSPERNEHAGYDTLSLRFEKPIGKDDTVRGSLRASFRGTLAGITGVHMYWPAGGERPQPKASVTLQAEVDFELSLSSVRYQAVRLVPDGDSQLLGEPFPGVFPDHRTVIALTDELSQSDYYIKQITENPPHGGGRATLVNRVWDISGRHYKGVFPIDFHITITGEEENHGGDFQPSAGNAYARLTVRGAYVDQEMRDDVENVWAALHKIVASRLGGQA